MFGKRDSEPQEVEECVCEDGTEEEPPALEDPIDELREKCKQDGEAQKLVERLQTCTERVNSRENTTETCAEELYDLLHHVDKCVSKTIFKKLK